MDYFKLLMKDIRVFVILIFISAIEGVILTKVFITLLNISYSFELGVTMYCIGLANIFFAVFLYALNKERMWNI